MALKNTDQKIYHKTVLDSRPRQDGLYKIIFRVKIDGIKKDYSTGIFWNKEYFDPERQTLLPRYKSDQEVKAANHKLTEIQSRASRIFLRFFVDHERISVKTFSEYFENFESSENFFWFAEQRTKQMYEKDIIANPTYRRHRSSLNRLKEFVKDQVLPLHEFNLELIEEFNSWARKKKYAHNTICGFHKNFKKFLSIAVSEKKIQSNPYKDFKFTYQDGNRAVLTRDEVKHLSGMLDSEKLSLTEQQVLRRFLFSCTTGIRISDTHRVKSSMIKDDVLYFTPYKTRTKGKKLKIPLSQFSKSLIAGREGLLFENISDKHINFCLKIIAAKAEIDKLLTYHVARDTFGTIFIELGGDVASLKDIMGHSNVKTTMIYVKMSDNRKQRLMNNFDTFLI